MESVVKRKLKKSRKKGGMRFKTRLMHFMAGMIVMTVVLLLLSMIFLGLMSRNHHVSMEQLLNLNEFYTHLENINQNVYEYTLEGDETIYRLISDEVMEGREVLKNMTETSANVSLYRDIRDMQEMFLSYSTRIEKIYDHSYLCEMMTIGSKRIINKYYSATQEVYEAINSEFQGLYSRLLDNAGDREHTLELQNRFFYFDIIVMLVCTAVYEILNVRSLARRVLQPVQALTDSVRQFEGQKEQSLCVVRGDMDEEMRHLLQVYNSMVVRIQRQMRVIQKNASTMERLKDQELENLRISNRLKTSELKALQMQINPHFLFNTLNMISQTAYLENASQTMGLLGSTARFLRYTLDNSDKSVTLAKEIEILGNYVELQEQRFGERISFEFDLDETFHQIQMPSMILQPLVENSISHGVGMKGEGARIRICTRYDRVRERGLIIILDNGYGMDQQTLEKVRREMKQSERIDRNISRKIGLSNVYLRLMIYYNQKAEMEVYSSPGTGTRIILALPCPISFVRREEEACIG